MKHPDSVYPRHYLFKRIVQAKLYIDKSFSEKIDLSNISEEAYFSKFHFIRLFKKIYNRTPHQYLIYVRIERAKILLAENFPVSEVCYAVGLESITSFTGLFKKVTGITPALWQQQQIQRKQETIAAPLKFIPNCFAESNGWTKNSNFEEDFS
jgi:AraC-like DNA-binding protein